MNKLLQGIAEIVGSSGLLTGDDVKARSGDWRGQTNCQALAIVRPASTEEVSAVMKLCFEAGQAVVTHGGLTGLVQGGAAGPEEIVLSLERMNKIEVVAPLEATMIVQAGAVLQVVQERAKEEGLMFPLDLGARGSCTIGGNISTNAGGNQVIRYGMMRQQVLGLEAVLADGTVISSMNSMLKNNAGYDLKQLFIGSEGTLGLVTRAVLKLQPSCQSENTALVAVPSFDNLTALWRLMGAQLGASLSAFEVMWQNHYRTVAVESGKHTAPMSPDYPLYALIESNGVDQARDAEQFQQVLEQAIEQDLIVDAVLAQSESQRASLWDIREDIEALVVALSPLFGFDVSLPMGNMEEYVNQVESSLQAQWPDKGRCLVFGHIGDGNLHIVLTVGSDSEENRQQVNQLIYSPLQAFGGSVSAEHGIGLDKRDYLSLSRTPQEIDLMRTLKRALDPKNILNPGKIFDL
ncbi:MAG: FAD-binding oxidoreductase [Proteobacteria bacterium]|nr:FAD-binding oxidoreductase [Pseudomonadota bacterium]